MNINDYRINKINLLLFFVFVSFPVLSLPIIFVEIYNKRYYALYYLAIFMGLIGYLWIPSGDLYRIQEDYQSLINGSFVNVRYHFDFIYLLILKTFAFCGFNFEYVRFTLCSISYVLYFKIFVNISRSNSHFINSKFIAFFSFLAFFFIIRFTGFVTGVRFTFAMALTFYATYQILFKNNKRGYIILLIAVFTHFTMGLIFGFIFLYNILCVRINKTSLLILIALGIVFSSGIFDLIIDFIPIDDSLKMYLKVYTSGQFAQQEYYDRTSLYRMSVILSYIAIYPSIIYYLIKSRKPNDYNIFPLILIFLAFTYNLNSIFSRYAFLGVIFFYINYLFNYSYNKISLSLIVFFTFALVTFSSSIYSVKRELKFGNQYILLYSPLPFVFYSSYDQNWIQSNIMENGSIKNSND